MYLHTPASLANFGPTRFSGRITSHCGVPSVPYNYTIYMKCYVLYIHSPSPHKYVNLGEICSSNETYSYMVRQHLRFRAHEMRPGCRHLSRRQHTNQCTKLYDNRMHSASVAERLWQHFASRIIRNVLSCQIDAVHLHNTRRMCIVNLRTNGHICPHMSAHRRQHSWIVLWVWKCLHIRRVRCNDVRRSHVFRIAHHEITSIMTHLHDQNVTFCVCIEPMQFPFPFMSHSYTLVNSIIISFICDIKLHFYWDC